MWKIKTRCDCGNFNVLLKEKTAEFEEVKYNY